MDLCFLGRGNSSNFKEGNTSAYFIDRQNLFLIDCGETIFSKVLEQHILDNIKEVHVLITHTHADHIGSLASFIMYCYFNIHKNFHIIISNNCKHKSNIEMILKGMGCSNKMYDFTDETYYDNKFNSFQTIRYIETKHVDYLDCYGIIFTTTNGVIYYSGDTRDTTNIDHILVDSRIKIDKIYVDVTDQDYDNNIHLYIGILHKTIPKDLRNRVYCMHFNNDNCIKLAQEFGFQIVDIKK